jgi:hypothetical protein
MTLAISVLALFAALKGLLYVNVYEDVRLAGTINKFLLTGSLAQDIVSLPLGLILALLSLYFLKNLGEKIFITILGLTGYFFYGYGLYAIQGQYTSIYPVYLAIFGLSLYSLIIGLASFDSYSIQNYKLSKAIRVSISIFLLMILIVLVPVWFLRMSPDIARHIPGDVYGVFVLDLAVVFPALAITAVKLIQARPFGYILAGVALLKTMTICLSVGFGELFQLYYDGRTPDYGMIGIFGTLTAVSLVLIFLYMKKLQIQPVCRSIKGVDNDV